MSAGLRSHRQPAIDRAGQPLKFRAPLRQPGTHARPSSPRNQRSQPDPGRARAQHPRALDSVVDLRGATSSDRRLRRYTGRLVHGRGHAPLQDDHGLAATAAHQRGSLYRLRQARRRPEHPQAHQRDQALAVRMQKAIIARSPKALGQHMLQQQPQERGAADGAQPPLAGLGVAPTIARDGQFRLFFFSREESE